MGGSWLEEKLRLRHNGSAGSGGDACFFGIVLLGSIFNAKTSFVVMFCWFLNSLNFQA